MIRSCAHHPLVVARERRIDLPAQTWLLGTWPHGNQPSGAALLSHRLDGLLSLRVQPGSQDWDVADVVAIPLVNGILVAAVIVEEPMVNPRNLVEVVGQLFAGGSGRHDRSRDF